MNVIAREINVPHSLSVINDNHSEYFNIQTASVRYLYIKIEILDEQDNVINELSGMAIDGSFNITDTVIRRTCNVTFQLEEGYLPTDTNSLFWINKKFHLFIGLATVAQDTIYWFDKGIYVIKDPDINITVNHNTITINGLDKMALYSGDIDGQLSTNTLVTVESGATRRGVVKAVMMNDGEQENNIIINNPINSVIMDEAIPYNIESAISDNTTDILDKVVDTLANYQYYYNLAGNFIFEPKPIKGDFKNSNIEWDFEQNNNIIISITKAIDYANIKNRITIWGGVHEDGYQPSYELILTDNDADFGDSPFTVEKLNEKHSNGSTMYRDYVEQCDDYVDAILDFINSTEDTFFPYNICIVFNNTYYRCNNENGTNKSKGDPRANSDWVRICTVDELKNATGESFRSYMRQIHAYSGELCKSKAKEVMFNCYLANDIVTINCVPIYSLDVNSVIIINDKLSETKGFYVIKDISCQLSTNGTMTITAHKLWD